jgi:cytochrome c-type biogenesis protein CcsB
MNIILLEQFFINSSFLSIFITTVLFFFNFNFHIFPNKINNILLFISFINIFLHLLTRWIITNHFPLSNLYESLVFLTFILLSFSIFFQFFNKKNFITIILLPIILFINAFSTFSLSETMQQPTSLVPALQSNWLLMHVTIMIISYAVLMVGSVFSIVFLVLNKYLIDELKISNSIIKTNVSFVNSKFNFSYILSELDNLSYRLLSFGFPLLTIGILSGAVWANETWGSFWNWDPKETWALITWFVYSIYLHSRIIKGLKGKKPALIASSGFVVIWICYLGVNIFGKGLHSYGWFYNT